jgi:alpha-tubulin suppressor-like RCC1 family protein
MRGPRRLWAIATVTAAILGGWGGCLDFASFACEQDGQCDAVDGGVCAAGGQCAYPDGDCSDGLRYDEHADGDVAGLCVDLGGSSTTLPDPSTAPTSLDSTVTASTSDTLDPSTSGSSSDGGTDSGEVCGAAGQPCCATGPSCVADLQCLGTACGCVAQVEAGERHTCVVLHSGGVLCWGANDRGQLGDSGNAFEPAPVPALAIAPNDPIREIRAVDHTCVRSEQGNIRCFGANDSRQVDPALLQPNAPTTAASWVISADHVGVGISHTCAADGVSMWCWGANDSSQLTGVTNGPDPIESPTGPVSSLELGGNFGCIVQSGALSCWGQNNRGQIATDPMVAPTMPTPTVMPVDDVSAVALGRTHTCALTNAGTIACWGRGTEGQLGDGLGVDAFAVVAVVWPPEAGVPIAIESGDQHTCAIDDGGALWCWGSNAQGQLMLEPDMNGFDDYTLVPVRVDVGVGVVAVTGGVTHTCALTEDARVLCWGTNTSGQIGDGTTNYAFEPQAAAIDCG